MKRKHKIIFLVSLLVAFGLVAGLYLSHVNIPVLEPAGQVASKERNLIFIALALSVIVVVPTFALTIFIIWKYRETNHRAKKYSPDWDHSRLFESVWWGIPMVIITILSVITWNSSHELDPYRTLVSAKRPLTVEVVALDWKWLFIYPEQNIASVNFLEVPVGTPINFQITSDTVMNSFWIPQLGGQIYAMPGMNTQLNLMADKAGSYDGSSANISGRGFADMAFVAQAGSQADFNQWVASAKQSPSALTLNSYSQLARPSTNKSLVEYSSTQNNLYDGIIEKYMAPAASGPVGHLNTTLPSMNGMGM